MYMFVNYAGLMAVAVKGAVFWVMTLHNLIELTVVLLECTVSIFRVSYASIVSRLRKGVTHRG
jgi:hypothetical protein